MIKKIFLLITAMFFASIATAIDYSYLKEKPLTIVVPYSPGGNSDIIGRLLASRITARTGIKTVVLNKPGANGSIASNYLVNQLSDGRTVMFGNTVTIFNALLGMPNVPALNEVDLIIPVMESPHAIFVSSTSNIKTYKDLVTKINSNENYSCSTSLLKIWVSMIADHEKVSQPQQIMYKSQNEQLTAVLKGEVLFSLAGISDAVPLVESGRLRPLAASTKKRIPVIPDVPTLQELGMKNGLFSGYFGIWASPNIDQKIKEELNMLFQDAIWDGQTISIFHAKGLVPIGGDINSSKKFYRFLVSDHTNLVSKNRDLLK